MPNEWAHMIELYGLFVECKWDPQKAKEFAWFYGLKFNKNDAAFYYFVKRSTKGLQAVVKIKESLGNWKDVYFFILETQVRGCFGSGSKFS